ncbi:SPOR domain-containing protein [uncultured Ferrimonas sp.]|uniref:SPOR domain-containing protein n=1 Tax=uncultured Ferrimonas sp. TaxID=432640 RepID=UPI002611EF05|nr:SPOR domain-containing protein [uncultured Ferrimonas sp.]
MASAFQNRLVGTVVLVAVAVLVLPEILDGEKATFEQQFATIPLRPSVAVAEVSAVAIPAQQNKPTWQIEPDEPSSEAKAKPSAAASDATTKPKISKPAVKPVPKPIKAGWSVRLGSFKNAANVNRLVAKLRQQQFPAYTIPAKPVDGQLTVVFVGPEIDQKRLQRMRADLAKKVDITGKIVPYDPLQL